MASEFVIKLEQRDTDTQMDYREIFSLKFYADGPIPGAFISRIVDLVRDVTETDVESHLSVVVKGA